MEIATFGWIGALIGCCMGVIVGKKDKKPQLMVTVLALIPAFFLGALLTAVALYSHDYCQLHFALCAKTTDTTIWFVAIPLIFSPVYWLLWLILASIVDK
jgi:ABC-type dipeptide/oligopeptide/nickel transport system permease subunit